MADNAITVNVPGVGRVSFPRSMSPDQITSAIRTKVIPQGWKNDPQAMLRAYTTPAQQAALARSQAATKADAPPEGPGFFGTLAADVMAIPGAIKQTVQHPLETGKQMWNAQMEQFDKARQAYQEGASAKGFWPAAAAYTGAAGHALAGALPLAGPAAAQAGEEFGEGRVGAGAAHTLELLAPEAAKVLPKPPPFRPLVRAAKMAPEESEALRAAEKAGVDLTAGQRAGRPGIQKVERALVNYPGSEERATAKFLEQQEQLGKWGRSLAGQASPTRTNAYESGLAVQDRLRQRIARLKGRADALYDSVRQDAAAAKQTVQTGERTLTNAAGQPILDASGQPIKVPVHSVIETPVNLEPLRKSLQPIYDDITRLMPEARRAYSPAYSALRDLMTSGERYMPAVDFDRTLSAVKSLARDGDSRFLTNQSQGVAKRVIAEGEQALTQALDQATPGTRLKLLQARKLVRGYHDTAEMLADMHEEPAALYNNLTTGGDRVLNSLKDLRQVAPRELQTVGRTYLEGMMDKATQEGGFQRSAGIMQDWKRMGPETKQLLFGATLTKDLDNFFLAAKRLAPAEGSATAGRLAALDVLRGGGAIGLGAAAIEYFFSGDPMRSGAAGVIAEAGQRVLRTHVTPNIAARLLLTPGGARLMTRALTLPPGTGVFREAVRALGARAALAQRQEATDRGL